MRVSTPGQKRKAEKCKPCRGMTQDDLWAPTRLSIVGHRRDCLPEAYRSWFVARKFAFEKETADKPLAGAGKFRFADSPFTSKNASLPRDPLTVRADSFRSRTTSQAKGGKTAIGSESYTAHLARWKILLLHPPGRRDTGRGMPSVLFLRASSLKIYTIIYIYMLRKHNP